MPCLYACYRSRVALVDGLQTDYFKLKEDERSNDIDDLPAAVDETVMIDAKFVFAGSHDHDGDGEEDHLSKIVYEVGMDSKPILPDQAGGRSEKIAVADCRTTVQEDAEAAALTLLQHLLKMLRTTKPQKLLVLQTT